MATNTAALIIHKKSLVKARRQREEDLDNGFTKEELEERIRAEKIERDKKAIKTKLTPEVEALAKRHRVDPSVYGNETTELVLFLEEERLAMEKKKAQAEAGIVERAPSRSYSFRDVKPLDLKFKTNPFGADGRFNEVAMKSVSQETVFRYEEIGGAHFDPFYDCSVRDTLEQSHYDGYHTQASVAPSVVKPAWSVDVGNDNGSVVSAVSAGSIGGGSATAVTAVSATQSKAAQSIPPILPVYFLEAIEVIPGAEETLYELALDEARTRHGKHPKKKINPYGNPYVYSSYSQGGTYLTEFEEASLHKDIDKALAKYEAADSAVMVEGYDPELVAKLGGDDAVEKMSKSLVDYSLQLRSRAAHQAAFLDYSADLVEACNRFNLSKVIVLFFKGDGEPNTMLNDAEPLFTHLIVRALAMDSMSNSTSLNSTEEDTGDRLKLQKILNEFVKYGVNIDIWRGNGQTALHTAAQTGNAKLVRWLLVNGADPRLCSKREGMSPLMFACKFGHIQVMSELIRVLGVSCLSETDPNGFTALHFCAASGQTRACTFLLDLGCDKRALDAKLRTAARVAQDQGFMATSQAISCHAYGRATGQAYLSFIDAQLQARARRAAVSQRSSLAQRMWGTVAQIGTQMNQAMGGLFRSIGAFFNRMFSLQPPASRVAPGSHRQLVTLPPLPTPPSMGNDDVRPFGAD